MNVNTYLKRTWHILTNHDIGNSLTLDKITSENHPHSNKEMVYTVNIMKCTCGLTWLDCGLEYRKIKDKQ